MLSHIILVDENDKPIGSGEKLAVHEKGLLHRAFSIVLYRVTNGQVQYLMQKRAQDKYHSGGLWSNTCCSHPHVGEDLAQACIRRLSEELGITQALTLHHAGSFVYKKSFDNGLTEHEFDHVFYGEITSDIAVHPNPLEMSKTAWMSKEDVQKLPKDQKTVWLQDVLDRVGRAYTP